jgi:5-hydroxyisourate hydrolase
MSLISTHILDTSRGQPASGVHVRLEHLSPDGTWAAMARGVTDADGRIDSLLYTDVALEDGDYRVVFSTGDYFRVIGVAAFYPEVVVHVRLEAGGRYHLPLLLSPFGYSTYRGS